MVRQYFKKDLVASGINGTFKGMVEVVFNSRLDTKEVHNRVLHEEEIRTVYWHSVNGYIGSDKKYEEEFDSKEKVWKYIDIVQKKVEASIRSLADTPRELSIEEDLIKHGFIN